MKKHQREKDIEEFYRLIWDSLQSHLEDMHSNNDETRKFAKGCVRDYTRMMVLLDKLSGPPK